MYETINEVSRLEIMFRIIKLNWCYTYLAINWWYTKDDVGEREIDTVICSAQTLFRKKEVSNKFRSVENRCYPLGKNIFKRMQSLDLIHSTMWMQCYLPTAARNCILQPICSGWFNAAHLAREVQRRDGLTRLWEMPYNHLRLSYYLFIYRTLFCTSVYYRQITQQNNYLPMQVAI